MKNIICNEEFKKLITPMTSEEYQELEANILKDGCRDAIVIWDQGERQVLLDGHNRFDICHKHSINFFIKALRFDTEDQAKEWIIRNQLARRNLSAYQKSILVLKLETIIKAKAREKQREAGGAVPQKSDKPSVHTYEELSKIAGVSHDTIFKVKYIQKLGTKEQKEKLRAQQESVNRVYRKIKHDEEIAESRKKKSAEVRGQIYQPIVTLADWKEWLINQPSPDLILTDPLYSSHIENINKFAKELIPTLLGKVKNTGRVMICIDCNNTEIKAYLNAGPIPEHIIMEPVPLIWIRWETIGPRPKHGYLNNAVLILHYRGKAAPPLNWDCRESEKSKIERFNVQDIPAPSASHGNRYHQFQKPDELARRIIEHTTKADDIVLDPFVGTGTFVLSATRLGRKGYGCDIDKKMLQIAQKRGCIWEKQLYDRS